MAQYKNAEGVVYNESDLRGWANKRGMGFDEYLEQAGLTYDKMDYDDAGFSDKLMSVGASTALGFVGFAEGLSDLKDGLIYTMSTAGENLSKEQKVLAMNAIKDNYGGDPFEKYMEKLEKSKLEFDEESITETFKEGDYFEGGFRAMEAGLQSLPSIIAAGYGIPGLIGLAASTAGSKFEEEFELTPEENAGALLFNAVGSGVIEATFELATRGVLKRAGLVAGAGGAANMKLAEEIVRGGAGSIIKNIGGGMASEAASEAATELTSTMWDQVTLGKKVDWDRKIYEIADAGIVGGLVGGVMAGAGEVKKKSRASQEMAYGILQDNLTGAALAEKQAQLDSLILDQKGTRKKSKPKDEDGEFEIIEQQIEGVLYEMGNLKQRSIQGLRNLNKDEFDAYFKNIKKARPLKKIIEGKKSAVIKDSAQKKYDELMAENLGMLQKSSDRKLEQNLSEAENRASQRNGKIKTFETQDEYIEAVSGVSAKKVKNKKTGNYEYSQKFRQAARKHRYSDGKIIDGVSYINKETAKNMGSVSVGSHEVLHSIMDKYVRNEDGTTTDEAIESIDDMLSSMSKGDRAILQARIDGNYRFNEDGSEKNKNEYYDEYLNVLHDAIVKKQITYNKNFEAVGGVFNKIFRGAGYNKLDLSTGRGLFNLVRTYTKAVETGKSTSELDKIIEETKGFAIKGKKAGRKSVDLGREDDNVPLNEKIDPLTKNAKTKEDLMKGGMNSPFSNIYQGILDGSFDRLFGSVSPEQRDIQRQNLADRFAGMTEEGGYDPAKSPSLFAWMQGNKRKGKEGNVEFAAKDAKKELAKDKERKTKSLDATKKTKEGEMKEDVEDTSADPEQQLIAKEKREQQEKALKQKEESFKKDLGLDVKLQKEIMEIVSKAFGGKLPPVTSPKYRLALQKQFTNDIGKKIEELFGTDSKYDAFIDKYFADVIFPNLSNARLIQLERLLPKGEKIFVSKRRVTKVKEVRKLQEQGLIDKKVKPASGPNLVQKMKLNMNNVKEFFNPPTINPKTGKESGLRGTRKRALADAIAEEIAFNEVQAVLLGSDVMNKVQQLNDLFGYEKVNNYAAEVQRQMDRGSRNSNSLDKALIDANITLVDVVGILSKDGSRILHEKHPEVYEAIAEDMEQKHAPGDFENVRFLEQVALMEQDLKPLIDAKVHQTKLKVDGKSVYKEDVMKDHVDDYSLPLLSFIPSWMGKVEQNAKSKYKFLINAILKGSSDRGNGGGDLSIRGRNKRRFEKKIENGMGDSKYMSDATKKLWADLELIKDDLVLFESTMTEPESVLRRVREVQAMNITAKQKAAILKKEFNPKALAAAQLLFKAYNSSIQDWFNSMTQGPNPKMTKAEAISYIIRDKQKNTNFNKGERALAALTAVYLTDKAMDLNVKYKGEHVVDSATVSAKTVVSIYNGTFLQDADSILKGFEQTYLPKELADVMDKLGGENSPLGNFRFILEPSIGKSVYDLASGKTMYDVQLEVYGKDLVKTIKNISDVSRSSNNLNKFYKAEQFRLDPNTKPKGISVFDFDETAGVSDNFIIASKNGVVEKIDSADWPLVGDSMVKDGWSMDFTDFNKVTNGRPGPLMQKLKNQIKKYGVENVFILTARAKESQGAIHAYLKSEGIDLPLKNITGLGNSTGEAKANWFVDKLAEGYNDVYFVDDAMPNVEAVDNLLSQFDIKSKVVQAVTRNSNSLNRQVNEMLEVNEGIGANVIVDDATAKVEGSRKGKGVSAKFFNTPGSNDFMGLMYSIASAKGKLGEAQLKFFEDNLYTPYRRGVDRINRLKQGVSNNYKSLLKSLPDASKLLKEIVPGTSFTYDTAIRVYLFNKAGYDIPGMSTENIQKLIEAVESNNDILTLASGVNAIVGSSDGKYLKPEDNWLGDTILSDLDSMTNDVGRKQHIQEFIENRKKIFGDWKNGKLDGPLMRKLQALYGPDYVEALNDMLWRMENGNSRPSGSNVQVNKWMNWLTNSIGAIMFFNTRSALLQTLSATNFINWGDNNPIKAAAAFANQKQFWKDFITIFNSDFLKQRRGGLQLDVNEAALAKAVNQGGKNKVKAAINYLLKIGFLPTQMADSFAIASGGATFYRNRIKTYMSQGMSKTDAEAKAFQDMTDASEPVQQSSDPSLISKEQASILGRIVLAFQNVTMQYTRRMKKSVIDLAKGRGDFKTNISRIVYYGAVQNLVFNSLQSALFALAFDEEEEEKKLSRKTRVANGMVDSILRGMGIPGAVLATSKNAIMEWAKQNKKGWSSDHAYTMLQLLNISPPIGSKMRKIYGSIQTERFNKKIIPQMSMWDVSNPRYQSIGNLLEGIFNIPMGRAVNKLNNIKQALDSDHATWQRIAMMLGWNTWDVGVKDSEILKIKEEVKGNKKSNSSVNKRGSSNKTTTKSKRGGGRKSTSSGSSGKRK